MPYSAEYNDYRERMDSLIRDVLIDMECQPILFVGAGLSIRYFRAPSWHDLLEQALALCKLDHDYSYFRQKYADPIAIGTAISDAVMEWAWGAGRKKFAKELFSGEYKGDIFLKTIRDPATAGAARRRTGSSSSRRAR
jgi:hypothetical protein